MSRDAIGLDIGGANLKAATASGQATSIPFELWQQPERLAAELANIRQRWPGLHRVAATMTGELCDCFPTKRDGVRHILAAVEAAFPRHQIGVWSTAGRFVSTAAGKVDHLAVAAANWHGLATYAGRFAPEGPAILIDTGSTTTDIIPLVDGTPRPAGWTDPERLQTGELVYMGVRRTPICALLGSTVVAEVFATAHDAHVLLGLFPEEPDDRGTADGQPMTREYAHVRLARMLGGDGDMTSKVDTTDLARRALSAQRAAVAAGIRRVIERLPEPPRTILLSGSGVFLGKAAWEEVAGGTRADVRIVSLSERLGPDVSTAACAYALAVLATEGPPWD